MECLLFTPTAKLLELNFALNFFAVFAGPIISPFASAAGESYQIILTHSVSSINEIQKM